MTHRGNEDGRELLARSVAVLRDFIDLMVRGAWRKPSESIETSAALGLVGPETEANSR